MENMNPSTEPITEGQIGKIFELFGSRLRKSNVQSKPLQDVIENQGSTLVDKLMQSLIEMVDAVSNLIIRKVKVNRTQSPKEILKATGRNQYVTDSVVAKMPKGNGDETEVFFFKLGCTISDTDLDKEYELRGLKPADPYSLAKVNEDDPAFADTHPNGTHWKDEKGNWCFATFDRFLVGRDVIVDCHDRGWDVFWWFAGVRK